MSTEIKKIKSRVAWASGGIYLMLAIVLVRLYWVSLVQGPELRAKSQERLIERHTIEAKRGGHLLCRRYDLGNHQTSV